MRLSALLFACLFSTAYAAEPDRHHDEHSYSEPDKVVIRDLGLDLRVDFQKKELRGSVDLALHWKDPAHRSLILDTRDLAIDKVMGKSGNGGWRRLKFELAARDPIFGQKLTISMRRPYDLVRVRYRTAPTASGLQWLEPSMTAGKKLPFMFSQSQAIHARSWVPLQDTPMRALHLHRAPGNRAGTDGADERRQRPMPHARWRLPLHRMQQPIPSYLMAIAVGDLVFKPISERSGVWAEPSMLDAAARTSSPTPRR
jgi:leukotriene-A4 hydrolase